MEEFSIFEMFNGIYSSYRPETLQYVALVAFKHVATCLGKRRICHFSDHDSLSTASSENSLLTLKKASCKHWKSMWPDNAQSFYQAQMGCDEVTGRLKVCVRKEHV